MISQQFKTAYLAWHKNHSSFILPRNDADWKKVYDFNQTKSWPLPAFVTKTAPTMAKKQTTIKKKAPTRKKSTSKKVKKPSFKGKKKYVKKGTSTKGPSKKTWRQSGGSADPTAVFKKVT